MTSRAFPVRPLVALLLVALPLAAAPVPKGMKAKPQNPDGQWTLVKFSADGEEPKAVPNMTRDWYIEGERLMAGVKGEPAHHAKGEANFRVRDPDRPTLRTWGTAPAVFAVDGDALRACYAHDGRAEFSECKPGPGVHYYEFERAK